LSRLVALTFLTRLIRLGSGLIASIITARALGPAGRGEYFLVITLSALLVQLGNLGLASSNTYLVARQPALLDRLVANSQIVAVVIGIGSAAALGLFLSTTGFLDVDVPLLWLLVALVPVTLFYLLGSNLLVGTGRLVQFNVLEVVSTLVVMTSIVLAALAWPNPTGVVLGSVIGSSVAAFVLARLLGRRPVALPRFDTATFQLGWRFAAKAYLATLFAMLLLRANVFLLEALAGSAALGHFSIATQIAESIGLFPASVALVLFPQLVRDLERSWATTTRAMLIVGLALLVVCAPLALWSEPLVRLVFGTQFVASAPAIVLLLPGVVALGMLTVMSQFVAASGFPITLVAAWAGAFVLVVVLGYLFVPVGSAAGAAASLSLGYTALFAMILVLGLRRRPR